jgi:hypothetical protein
MNCPILVPISILNKVFLSTFGFKLLTMTKPIKESIDDPSKYNFMHKNNIKINEYIEDLNFTSGNIKTTFQSCQINTTDLVNLCKVLYCHKANLLKHKQPCDTEELQKEIPVLENIFNIFGAEIPNVEDTHVFDKKQLLEHLPVVKKLKNIDKQISRKRRLIDTTDMILNKTKRAKITRTRDPETKYKPGNKTKGYSLNRKQFKVLFSVFGKQIYGGTFEDESAAKNKYLELLKLYIGKTEYQLHEMSPELFK